MVLTEPRCLNRLAGMLIRGFTCHPAAHPAFHRPLKNTCLCLHAAVTGGQPQHMPFRICRVQHGTHIRVHQRIHFNPAIGARSQRKIIGNFHIFVDKHQQMITVLFKFCCRRHRRRYGWLQSCLRRYFQFRRGLCRLLQDVWQCQQCCNHQCSNHTKNRYKHCARLPAPGNFPHTAAAPRRDSFPGIPRGSSVSLWHLNTPYFLLKIAVGCAIIFADSYYYNTLFQ